MPTRPTPTLTLLILPAITLAAIALAAAAIGLLTLRPCPAEPGPEPAEGAHPEPAEGPRPEPVEGAHPEPVEGPTLTLIADTILDASTGQPISADVYVNGTLIHESVTHFQVTVPLDGSTEIRVVAPGYKPWGVTPQGGGSDKVMQGPVRLQPG